MYACMAMRSASTLTRMSSFLVPQIQIFITRLARRLSTRRKWGLGCVSLPAAFTLRDQTTFPAAMSRIDPFTSGLYIKTSTLRTRHSKIGRRRSGIYPGGRMAVRQRAIRLLMASIIQNGEKLVGKAGDVVFVPKGANYTSLKNPFKAFL